MHGDCSSRGCYAMTDEQIAEIYALGRESFFGGQNAFQFQAYPFRMTPINMAKHRNNPNMPFWKMIKEGYDHFEVTRQEPKVDFCEKKYVFDAVKPPDANARPGIQCFGQMPGLCDPGRNRRCRAREAAEGPGRDRQTDRQGNAGRAAQHRHRRRHEPRCSPPAFRTATPDCRTAARVRSCRLPRCPAPPAPFHRRSIRRMGR